MELKISAMVETREIDVISFFLSTLYIPRIVGRSSSWTLSLSLLIKACAQSIYRVSAFNHWVQQDLLYGLYQSKIFLLKLPVNAFNDDVDCFKIWLTHISPMLPLCTFPVVWSISVNIQSPLSIHLGAFRFRAPSIVLASSIPEILLASSRIRWNSLLSPISCNLWRMCCKEYKA